jgi:hypothetical protein
VFVEFKEPQPLGTVDARTSPAAFPGCQAGSSATATA